MSDVPHLRVVHAETGEVVDSPELERALTQIRMLERDLAGKRLKIADLERDYDKIRDQHPRRRDIERVHAYWQKRCGHPRARLDNPEFFAIASLLLLGGKRHPEFAWPEDFKAAVDGAAYDPFVTTRKNGTRNRHDSLGLIFRDAAHMRDFIAKAPAPKQPRPQPYVADWAR